MEQLDANLAQLQSIFYFSTSIKESKREKQKKRKGRRGGKRGSESGKKREGEVLFNDFTDEIQLDWTDQVSTVPDWIN